MPVNEMNEVAATRSPKAKDDRVEMNEQAQSDNQIADYRNCFNCFIILVMQWKEHDLPAFSPSSPNVSTGLRLRHHGLNIGNLIGCLLPQAKARYRDTPPQF